MTILSAFDQASKLMGKGAQTTLVNNTDPFAIEMLAFANELGPEISTRHDWNVLMTLHTEAGDGVTTAFPFPADYHRMPVDTLVFQNSTKRPMTHVIDLDVWLHRRLDTFSSISGEWTILGGQIHFYVSGAAMSASESAKYYYLSNLIVDPVAGSNKTTFTVDTDVFRLPERLMKLGLMSKWLQSKGLPYAQEFADFELAMSQEIARDKGPRKIKIGRPRLPVGAELTYPGQIIP